MIIHIIVLSDNGLSGGLQFYIIVQEPLLTYIGSSRQGHTWVGPAKHWLHTKVVCPPSSREIDLLWPGIRGSSWPLEIRFAISTILVQIRAVCIYRVEISLHAGYNLSLRFIIFSVENRCKIQSTKRNFSYLFQGVHHRRSSILIWVWCAYTYIYMHFSRVFVLCSWNSFISIYLC